MLTIEIIFWISVFCILYTYIGYPLLLACCYLILGENQKQHSVEPAPYISIVLAAYNEERHICKKLENCLSLNYPRDKVEILVGSDGSTDKTNELVEKFKDNQVKLFPYSPRRGKMATVNRLVKEATGEICVFSDISELFDHDALLNLNKHFSDPAIGAVTGNHIYNESNSGLGKGTAFYWKVQRFLQRVESRIHTIFSCDGTIYACRRDIYPFPPDDTINDDVAVPLGIISKGKRIIFEPNAIARGDVLVETNKFFSQKIRSQAGKYQNFIQASNMFVPWPIHRWLLFISHSVFPVIVPWFMVIALISNIVLVFHDDWIYRTLLIGQILFYTAAMFGLIAERLNFKLPIVSIPFYFVTANLGSLLGFFAFATGKQKTTWRKVE